MKILETYKDETVKVAKAALTQVEGDARASLKNYRSAGLAVGRLLVSVKASGLLVAQVAMKKRDHTKASVLFADWYKDILNLDKREVSRFTRHAIRCDELLQAGRIDEAKASGFALSLFRNVNPQLATFDFLTAVEDIDEWTAKAVTAAIAIYNGTDEDEDETPDETPDEAADETTAATLPEDLEGQRQAWNDAVNILAGLIGKGFVPDKTQVGVIATMFAVKNPTTNNETADSK